MKQFSLLFNRSVNKLGIVMLTVVLTFGFKNAIANRVVDYTPSCVTAGQTLTIGVNSTTTWAGSWFHWQYRVTPVGGAPGAWTFLSGVAAGTTVNNTINGTVFAVSNANLIAPVNNFSYNLSIANATTALNDVEFRVLVGPFGDPQTVTTPVWNGDDQNVPESRTVRVRVRPATENCFSGCSDNLLVTTPPSTINTPMAEFYGGFETTAANFGGTNPNGSSVTAQTDLAQWSTGTPVANSVGSLNNAYSMIWNANRYAPHSGKNMMAAYQVTNNSRVWYKTLVAPSSPTQQFFSGQLTFRVWASKTGPNAEAPCFALEVKGTNASNTTLVLNTLPVTMTTTAGQPGNIAGDWVQYSLSYFVPAGVYKALEVSVRGNCTVPTNFAIDDICLVAPVAAVLPVRLTTFSGSYYDGVSHLAWITEQESNTSHFEIQQSADGVNFSPVGKVSAVGNTVIRQQYGFDDVKAAAGINYYRLKIIDRDGRFEYSNIVSLNVSIKGLHITRVYPTPFSDNFNISISSDVKTKANIRLLDNTGRVLVNEIRTVNKGVNLISVNNLSRLAKGFYIVEVKADGETFTQKVIK